jgi:WD40 repeat protein
MTSTNTFATTASTTPMMYHHHQCIDDHDIRLEHPGKDTTSALAWSPCGTRIAASSWDGTVRLWDIHYRSSNTMVQATFRGKGTFI